jgi:hypothetical protein
MRVNIRWNGEKGVLYTAYNRVFDDEDSFLGHLKKDKYGWYYYLPPAIPCALNRGDLLGIIARMKEVNDRIKSEREVNHNDIKGERE